VVEPDLENLDNYRLGFFNGSNLGQYRPQCPPSNYIFNYEDLRDFIFTKMYNGYVVAMSVPPMNRLFTVPRREAIKELGNKYEQTDRKEDRKREQSEAKKMKRIVNDTGDPLLKVALIEGRGLVPRENATSSPFCELRLHQQIFRSSQIKKNLNPRWNAEFVFRLAGVRAGLDDFQVVCLHQSKDGKTDYLGEHSILFNKLVVGEAIWLKLYSTTTEEVTGELKLKFTTTTEEIYRKEQEKGNDSIVIPPDEVESLTKLAKTITPENGISLKDRNWHLTTYKRCIIGSELVDWFLETEIADTREEAILIGRKLRKLNLLLHVKKETMDFKDGYIFYRLTI